MKTATGQGQPVPPHLIGALHDSAPAADNAVQLQAQLANDGYVMISHFFAESDIVAARKAVFSALAEMGEITGPPEQGIFSGDSQRRNRAPDLGAFWREVSEQWALRRLSHGTPLHQLTGDILSTPSRAQDYVFLRPTNPGKFTHLHCDAPFFTRLTNQVVTVWIALGEIPLELGPLFIVENSHRNETLRAHYKDFDVARDTDRQATLPQSPQDWASEHGTRLLTRNFTSGDILVFGMNTLHGTFDNVADDNRCRLSCDVRYQAASAPLDPRYFGANPTGTTGVGYGELVGAKPLTDDWHVR